MTNTPDTTNLMSTFDHRPCPDCRTTTDPEGDPGQEYWCPACVRFWPGDEDDDSDPYRPTVVQFIGLGLWVLYLAALLLTFTGIGMHYLQPHFPATENGRNMAAFVSAGVAFIPFLVAGWVSNWLLRLAGAAVFNLLHSTR